MSAASLEMMFSNFSSYEFDLGFYFLHFKKGADGSDPTQGYASTPSTTLQASSGQTSLSTYGKFIGDIGNNDVDLACAWVLTSPTPFRFGLHLHVPPQIVGFGSDPSWEVSLDDNAVANSETPVPDWTKSGKHASDPYTWPTTLPVKIVATPTISGEAISVSVVITDPDS